MQQNAYLLAKIGADTAENERNFAKNCQLPYGSPEGPERGGRPRRAARRRAARRPRPPPRASLPGPIGAAAGGEGPRKAN